MLSFLYRKDDYTRIHVRDMNIMLSIGVNDWEKLQKQRVLVNVTAFLRMCSGPRQDKIEDTVSYDFIADTVRRVSNTEHINLVETLAENIADACLDDSRIKRVIVRVEKPDIYEDGVPGVEISRSR